MARLLLIVPHFWDPVCVPLGISSLKAFADAQGHEVELLDFNTIPEIFGVQRAYFSECKAQFPYFKDWNIERNGTEMLAIHQMLYLFARNRSNYPEMVGQVLNLNGRNMGEFMAELKVSRFDALFASLYSKVSSILARVLNGGQFDVVGCSLFNSTWPATLFLLKRVKSHVKGVRTVVGGPGPLMGITSRAEEVIRFIERNDFIDYFVVGEGEYSLLRILEDPMLPPGVIDPGHNLTIVESRKNFVKPEELPAPDYGQLDISRYLQLSVASSRGCPFDCSFCAETVFWKGYRAFKGRTFDQMEILAQRYNRASFYLCDSLSNTTIGPIASEITKNSRPYTLDCYLRADKTVAERPHDVRAWRQGGLVRARLGMESASQRILDAMVKKTTPELMERSLDVLSAEGIITSTLWIVAYPGETEGEFNDTLNFIRANRARIYQADAWLFQYHPAGLAHSGEIEIERGSHRRYSDDINQILAVSPYVVDRDISMGARFERLERFVRTMRELEIPNPYSVYEWMAAEGRWTSLGRSTHWDIETSMMALNA
ncbi:MAG: B12-binding domain-containing radical SAM protein [Acidobacteria bacterium]|nr:B12-binding domain-containing radical SAM protein [Acidobacteriota bacterium]